MRTQELILALGLASMLAGCSGGVTLAPHLNREHELAPAAAAGRFGVVADRAATFENQNQKSRDVHWYRMWRARALVGMGQLDQASALIEQILIDVSGAPAAPAQADRLRMFGYDLRAQVALEQGRPKDALVDLDRAFNLATEVGLETRGDCDAPLALLARARQLEDVAKRAGDAVRVQMAHVALERHLEKWTRCLAEHDYPGLGVVGSLTNVLQGSEPVVQAPVKVEEKTTAAAKKDPPPRPATKVEEKKEKPLTGVAALPTVNAQYAPIDPGPWRESIDAAVTLAAKHFPSVKGDVVIRTDGQHHALRLRVSIPRFDNPEALVPLLRATVVFFEQSRAISPKVERVLVTIDGNPGPILVVAQKNDVIELFQERLDAAGLVKRLARVM